MEETQPVADATPVTPTETKEEVVEETTAPEIDYKAEYEKTLDNLKKAEYTLYKKNKEEKEQEPIVDPFAEQDISELVTQQVEAKMAELRGEVLGNVFEESLDALSSSEDEKNLIRLHYEKSIVKTGHTRQAVLDDLQKAKLLANAPNLAKEREEMVLALKAKKTAGSTGRGTNLDKSKPEDDLSREFSAHDWQWMKDHNFTEDMKKKAAKAAKDIH